MKLLIPVTYPVPPAVLLRAFTDYGFHEEKIRYLNPISFEILDHQGDSSDFTIRVRRNMRNEAQVPALIKKLIPVTSFVEHEDRWDATYGVGKVSLSIEGLPVRLTCSLIATAAGTETVLSHDWDIQCRLPVVGSAVERFIAGDLPRLMELEADAARPLLARYA